MAKFIINKGYDDPREVEAREYQTVGDFIDFYDGNGIKLRIRAKEVDTIDRED